MIPHPDVTILLCLVSWMNPNSKKKKKKICNKIETLA
jgi:hypothetical protein